jgi:hypothetical protein
MKIEIVPATKSFIFSEHEAKLVRDILGGSFIPHLAKTVLMSANASKHNSQTIVEEDLLKLRKALDAELL